MKTVDLHTLSVDQLVERFIELAVAQDRAEFEDNIRRVNTLFDDIETIKTELKVRTGDQRRALMALYNHPNAQVRLKAAHATLAIAPVAARKVLQILSESRIFPQAANAGMALDRLDSGEYKPT